MTIYFAANPFGFYDDAISEVPNGAVEISLEDHADLLSGQAQGKVIVADASGKPSLADPAPPTPAQILANNSALCDRFMALATAQIAPLQDATDLGDATADEAAALTVWKQYRVALNRLDLTPLAVAWPAQPELQGNSPDA